MAGLNLPRQFRFWKRRSPLRWFVTLSAAFVLLVKLNTSTDHVEPAGSDHLYITTAVPRSSAVQRPSAKPGTISNHFKEPISSQDLKNKMKIGRRRFKTIKENSRPYVSEQVSETVSETLAILDEQIAKSKKEISNFTWDTKQRKHFLIVSSWRTGSSFFGHVIAKYPAIFHVHEPLMYAGVRQIRDVPEDESLVAEALRNLRDIMQCKYSVDYTKHFYSDNGTLDYVTSHNLHTTKACAEASDPYTCRDATYMQQACRRFPIFMAKIVRIRLRLLEPLLADRSFPNLKIAYLIRDPRATMNSRYRTGTDSWCWGVPDCMEPDRLCSDVIDDLVAFGELDAKYPNRLILLQYESMAVQPQKYFERVYNFLDLEMPSFVNATVKQLTSSKDTDDPYGVFRLPEERLEAWRKELSRQQIDDINQKCGDVVRRIGYSP